jgi:aminoglycoside phosphotransferase (APT) family kinase protein
LVGDVYDCYAQYRGKIKEGDYCLNHGDFTAKHIFTDCKSVTGVIDWEWNAFTNPINDYAIFLNSLLDKGTQRAFVSEMLSYLDKKFDNANELDFYMGRRFLLGAIFPHKNKVTDKFSRRKLLFGRLLLKKEITFEEFVRDIYDKTTFTI